MLMSTTDLFESITAIEDWKLKGRPVWAKILLLVSLKLSLKSETHPMDCKLRRFVCEEKETARRIESVEDIDS